MIILQAGVELFHVDGPMDIHIEANSCRSHFCKCA